MKKFLAILTILFLISPIFAKTAQYVESYSRLSVSEIVSDIQSMINQGWKVVLITSPVTKGWSDRYQVIVLFKKEE